MERLETELNNEQNDKAPAQKMTQTIAVEHFTGSLLERANKLMKDPEYVKHVKALQNSQAEKAKTMAFDVGHTQLIVPYVGKRLTKGYLTKESAAASMLFYNLWQRKFFALDLVEFTLKYYQQMEDETNYKKKQNLYKFSQFKDVRHFPNDNGIADKEKAELVFDIVLDSRTLRLQAECKWGLQLWLRAFAAVFEIRNVMSLIDDKKRADFLYAEMNREKNQ